MKTIVIKDMRPFCKYKNREIGIAYNCFAAEKFKETSEDEYKTQVAGESFGWIDNQGVVYRDSKYTMTRPTEKEVIEALEVYPKLKYFAMNFGYAEEEYEQPNPMDYPDTPQGDAEYMDDYWQGNWEAMAYHDDMGDR